MNANMRSAGHGLNCALGVRETIEVESQGGKDPDVGLLSDNFPAKPGLVCEINLVITLRKPAVLPGRLRVSQANRETWPVTVTAGQKQYPALHLILPWDRLCRHQ